MFKMSAVDIIQFKHTLTHLITRIHAHRFVAILYLLK